MYHCIQLQNQKNTGVVLVRTWNGIPITFKVYSVVVLVRIKSGIPRIIKVLLRRGNGKNIVQHTKNFQSYKSMVVVRTWSGIPSIIFLYLEDDGRNVRAAFRPENVY